MKTILEFNLPDDQDNFNAANNGMCYMIALEDIRQELRNHWKYDKSTEDTLKSIEEILNEND